MGNDYSTEPVRRTRQSRRKVASASTDKSTRTMLLSILFQVSWPQRLTKKHITDQILLYGGNPQRALYRDIETLTGYFVEELPTPDETSLDAWCVQQQQSKRLALTYDRQTKTFGLAQSIFSIDITEEEARAFVALKDGFSPGTPYAQAIQYLLRRWEWLFSEKSRQLVEQKRKRRARPVLLPLSPVVDYSQHGETLLQLDAALEKGAYISFAYTPLTRSRQDEPEYHRDVEPYELEYRDGHWYLTCYLFDGNTYLDYRVDRIHPQTLSEGSKREHFVPGLRQRRGVKISYWVSPLLARHGSVSARLREQKVEFLDDGKGAIVEGYAKSIWWARRLLLGYGRQVKALAPEELVQTMSEETSAMSQLYDEGK